jgi:hypothetical protein
MYSNATPGPPARVLDEHAHLQQSLGALREAVWRTEPSAQEVIPLAEELAAELEAHFAHEESGGLFAGMTEAAPNLAARASDLVAQHEALTRQFSGFVEFAAAGGPLLTWRDGLRDRLAAFLADFARHEAEENRLIQEAYARDLGLAD